MKNPITGEEANISRGVIPPDRNNFQPRVGIAHQINPGTVIRTSYGIFFDTFGINTYHSNYNTLSLVLQFRFAARLSFSVNYTWSKSIIFFDELSDNIQLFGMLPAGVNVAQGRGVSGWDVPHRTTGRWFNTSAFRVPAAFTFGNAGRNILRTDGLANWDFSVYKQFSLQETKHLELRGEFYDFLNQATFGYPGFVVDVPAQFGRVSSTRASGRSVQLGVRLRF